MTLFLPQFMMNYIGDMYQTQCRTDFDFEIVNFPFLDGDVPCSTSYGVYISQPIRLARAYSHFADLLTLTINC